jgi:hypothetical protein
VGHFGLAVNGAYENVLSGDTESVKLFVSPL